MASEATLLGEAWRHSVSVSFPHSLGEMQCRDLSVALWGTYSLGVGPPHTWLGICVSSGGQSWGRTPEEPKEAPSAPSNSS